MLKYTLENTREFLNFEVDELKNIESIPWDYPEIWVKGLRIKFSEYYFLSNFLYFLKRQSDFGIQHPQEQSKIDFDSLKHFSAFDNSFVLISTRPYEEEQEFKEDLKKFHRKAPKCFWGNYLDSEKLELNLRNGRKEILEYSTIETLEKNKKVLIEKPNQAFDDREFVYIQTDSKPSRSLDVAYIFEKLDDKLLNKIPSKNNWIY